MRLDKITLPTAILFSIVVLSFVTYAMQTTKQKSIEEQNRSKIEQRVTCSKEAKESAVFQYDDYCMRTPGCNFNKPESPLYSKPGTYFIANYENAYKTCLREHGLDNL